MGHVPVSHWIGSCYEEGVFAQVTAQRTAYLDVKLIVLAEGRIWLHVDQDRLVAVVDNEVGNPPVEVQRARSSSASRIG